jgi:predicted GNAT superfamily acetyltransferase
MLRANVADMHVTQTAEGVEAERTAAEAASQAGVRVAELTEPHEASELAALFREVWQTGVQDAPVSPDFLRALTLNGQYVVAAHREGELVGGSMGFRMEESGNPWLHSHITAVRGRARGRHVGFALKLHQRAWALQRGLVGINWTFDPLVRRNAYFNLTKLGASAERYLVNAYGDMTDPVNAGGPSDRYVAEWPVTGRRRAPAAGPPDDADVVLCAASDGTPLASKPTGAARRIAWIPEDILLLRRRQPELAQRWRLASRAALLAAMEDGFVACAMTRDGWYVLERRA